MQIRIQKPTEVAKFAILASMCAFLSLTSANGAVLVFVSPACNWFNMSKSSDRIRVQDRSVASLLYQPKLFPVGASIRRKGIAKYFSTKIDDSLYEVWIRPFRFLELYGYNQLEQTSKADYLGNDEKNVYRATSGNHIFKRSKITIEATLTKSFPLKVGNDIAFRIISSMHSTMAGKTGNCVVVLMSLNERKRSSAVGRVALETLNKCAANKNKKPDVSLRGMIWCCLFLIETALHAPRSVHIAVGLRRYVLP